MRVVALSIVWSIAAGCVLGGGEPDVECDAVCPAGTRRAEFNVVERGEGGVVVGDLCEVYCEPEIRCLAPQLPSFYEDAQGNSVYECASVEGVSGIPQDAEVDFSFATAWEEP